MALTVKHRIRTKDGGKRELSYSRTKAIKLFCMECLGWGDHPEDCTAKLCPLWPFRGRTAASLKGVVDNGAAR